MRRGTTPTVTVSVNGFDLNKVKVICLSFRQVRDDDSIIQLDKYGGELTIDKTNKTVSYKLKQRETLNFEAGKNIDAQLRVLDTNDDAFASSITSFYLDDVINESIFGNG